MSESIIFFGATSAMAMQTARIYAAQTATLGLVGRDTERLEALAADLRLRGAARVEVFPEFDALEPGGPDRVAAQIRQTFGRVDTVLIAYGSLPDQTRAETDAETLRKALEVNFISVAQLSHAVADWLADQGGGTLAVIGSVAGLRGRQSNYVYGSAKGGLHLFLQGLRNRLHPRGVRVLTLAPGFVDSPMTRDVPKGPLFVSAEKAGRLIHRAITRSRRDVVYIPGFWWGIMAVIRCIPEPLFKRLKL